MNLKVTTYSNSQSWLIDAKRRKIIIFFFLKKEANMVCGPHFAIILFETFIYVEYTKKRGLMNPSQMMLN